MFEPYIKNESYRKMMDIINRNKDRPLYTKGFETHHIIPKCYYKLNNIPIDNSKDNLVCLSYIDHLIVHYYSIECINEQLKYSMINSAQRLLVQKKHFTDKELISIEYLTIKAKVEALIKIYTPNSKLIYCYTNQKIYLSIADFARDINANPKRITMYLKKGYSHYRNYKFDFVENLRLDDNGNLIEPKRKPNKYKGQINGRGYSILCLENQKIYKGSGDVCKAFGWDLSYSSSISQNCKGKMKQCRGYHFVYCEDK